MSYRILHLADLHLERAFAGDGAYGEVAMRRREGLREALRRAGSLAAERGCQLVSIGGDLFEHERAGADTAAFLSGLFASWAPTRVAIAPGNHDPLLPGSIYDRADWPDNVHVFSEPTLRPLDLGEGLKLWGLAHREQHWMGDPLDCPAVGDEGGMHLALFHGAELGSRPDNKSIHGPFRAEAIGQRGFALALCGHYHRRRLDADARLVYPGSPEPLTFEEEGERGPVLVEVADGGHIRLEPLLTNSWHAVRADCDLEDAASAAEVAERVRSAAITATSGLPPERSMLRLTLRGELPGEVAVDAARVEAVAVEACGAAVLRVRDLTAPAVDLAGAAADRSARGAFTRELLGRLEATSDDDERSVLSDALRYGLQALDGTEVGLR